MMPSTSLVVDPHPILREGMCCVLSSSLPGSTVDCVADFSKALDFIRQREVHLVISDFRINGTHVPDFIADVRSSGFKTKWLVLSSSDEVDVGYPAVRAGASGFVAKSAPVANVLDAIRLILAGHNYCSERLSRMLMSRVGEESKSAVTAQLSAREVQIFSLLGECLAVSDIAHKLGLAVKTVESHREHIKNKLGYHNAAQVTAAAVRWLDDNSITI